MKLPILAIVLGLVATSALAQSRDAPGANPADQTAAAPAGDGAGVVRAVNAKAGKVTLHHGPIAALGWPAMTMTFKAEPALLKDLKVGQSVKFTVGPDGDELRAISPQ